MKENRIFEKSISEIVLPPPPSPSKETDPNNSNYVLTFILKGSFGKVISCSGFFLVCCLLSLGGISKKYFCSSSRLLHEYKNYPCVNFYLLDKMYYL